MNEERYILARFVRELMAQDDKARRERGYSDSWNLSEICTIIEQIRADAVLGEPTEKDLPWAESEEE
jgi:hypothetical protein